MRRTQWLTCGVLVLGAACSSGLVGGGGVPGGLASGTVLHSRGDAGGPNDGGPDAGASDSGVPDAGGPDAGRPPAPAGGTHIDFTDLNVGSGTGGDTGNGVYLRVFGHGFGTSQGSSTVSLGGGTVVTACAHCFWSDTQLVVQVGPAARTGPLVITVGGVTSNGVAFAIVPTTIVFVAATGLDTNPGTFAAPFKTWRAAFNSVTGNDNSDVTQNTVIYLEPGVDVTQDDGRGYRSTISTDHGGVSALQQLSIVGYPGGTVNVGSVSVDNGIHGYATWLTLANLNVIGRISAIDAEGGNIRIINNSLSCPSVPAGTGGTACVLGETQNPEETWIFQGNNVHDTGGNVDKTYHAVYFSSGVNHADVGWNVVGPGFKGYCRGIMFHATTGANNFDLHVHDNIISNSYCDGLALASVDPSKGPVEAYNNVVFNVALASNPYGVANEAGIAVNTDPPLPTSGVVQVYNNTVVNAGAYTQGNQNGCFGVVTPGATLNLVNNICVQPNASQPYVEAGTAFTASHNLWFGAGTAPSGDSHPVQADPKFVSASSFELLPDSPAIGAGLSTPSSAYDLLDNVRSTPPSLGAYEK